MLTPPMLVAAAVALLGVGLCVPQQVVHVVETLDSGALYNATGQRSYSNATRNTTIPVSDGICYVEVPTASLVKDPRHAPRGNGSTPVLSRIRTCCEGYRRDPHIFRRCEPVCRHSCGGGVCSAPDTCSCYPGHTKNLAEAAGRNELCIYSWPTTERDLDLRGFCVPTCPASCQNGRCSGGECVCEPGFQLARERQYCVPACRDNCGGHGNCTAPNTCDCPREYPRGDDGLCRASCPNCEHGDCLGPNQCRCHRGYSKNGQGACAPVCSKGCQNGICAGPELCTCQYGFSYDEALGLCQPKCLNRCYNALCTGPDTCTCKPGYIPDKNSALGNVCQPHCPEGCENGVCSNPNFCICNYGFVKDKKTKKCVKRV